MPKRYTLILFLQEPNEKPPPAPTGNGFYIDFLLPEVPEDIICFAYKLYHSWSVLARGVFFIPKIREKERNDRMSVQKNQYTSKRTGKTKTQYFASVWYAKEKRAITGPMRSTEKAARQDETDIQRAIEREKAPVAPKKRKIRMDTIYEEWHEATKPPVYANSTWEIYARFYRDYIQEVFGQKTIDQIRPIHVQKYVNLMAKKYSPETVNKCLNILIDIFCFAVEVLQCRLDNPASGIKRCKVKQKPKTVWNDDQITYFLSLPEVQESSYYPMLCLSAALGPRPGEVCGLRENCLLTDPCYMIQINRGYDNWDVATDLKNDGSHRTPPIPKYLYKLIRRRLIWKKKCRMEFEDWGQNDYLFVSSNGVPIKPRQYARAFKRLLLAHNKRMEDYLAEHGKLPDRAQILPYLTLYGFRTSFATNNMRKRPNAALISSIMGNSPKTLLQFYTQSDTEMQSEIVNNYLSMNG